MSTAIIFQIVLRNYLSCLISLVVGWDLVGINIFGIKLIRLFETLCNVTPNRQFNDSFSLFRIISSHRCLVYLNTTFQSFNQQSSGFNI